MATTEYYDETYVDLEELLARAQAAGARRVEVVEGEWQESPSGPVFQAAAEVETAEGRTARRMGRARPGDSRGPNPASAEADDQVESRAEARAVRAALRTAYPAAELAEGQQAPHVKMVQAMVRRAAAGMGLSRDELAAIIHQRYAVTSLNDVTPAQADAIFAWLESRVSGEDN